VRNFETTGQHQYKGGGRKKIRWGRVLTVGLLAATMGMVVFMIAEPTAIGASAGGASAPVKLGSFRIVSPTIKWGFALDTFEVAEHNITNGQSFSVLLTNHQVSGSTIEQLVAKAEDVFDLRKFQAGKTYTLLSAPGADGAPQHLVYEPNPYEYILFNLQGDHSVSRVERPVDIRVEKSYFEVSSTLWKSMVDQGYSYEFADRLEDALRWSIDFYRIQEGDEFKAVFENKYVEGKSVGVGQVKAAHYKSGRRDVYAIYYENGEFKGYYDLEGRPLKTNFLKAPVRFSRISSRYSMRRFHPVLKYNRPHLGTDYAAPHGTEIFAVGDGVVTNASYNSGNGNFVKIRHDKVYETQYLHMSRFAKGIRPGVRVSQGQVIGYVGSTGLATGPHVCFRFWQNGKQVDHLRVVSPPAKPLPSSEMSSFNKVKDALVLQLNEEEKP
jgi:murein DD-endopeptidase MepM/ murein hydrolase activator NlpD